MRLWFENSRIQISPLPCPQHGLERPCHFSALMNDFRANREPLVPPGGSDLHARDMSATFAADVTLRAARQRLRELDQWLPVDGDPDLPLGMLVERNSTGPL